MIGFSTPCYCHWLRKLDFCAVGSNALLLSVFECCLHSTIDKYDSAPPASARLWAAEGGNS